MHLFYERVCQVAVRFAVFTNIDQRHRRFRFKYDLPMSIFLTKPEFSSEADVKKKFSRSQFRMKYRRSRCFNATLHKLMRKYSLRRENLQALK